MKEEVKIENWFVLKDRLYGEVEWHPKLGTCLDGVVTTSPILRIETLNTVYIVGNPATGKERTKRLLPEDTFKGEV